MKRLIIYFLIILAAAWVGVKIYEQPGYVMVLYQHWVIETTTWFLILILLLAFFAFHLLLILFRKMIHLPSNIEDWWRAHKRRKAIKNFNRGYLDLLSGRWKPAQKYLLKSAKDKPLAFTNYSLAAEAADALHMPRRRDQYLAEAKRNAGKAGYVADVQKVNFYLKHYQSENALTELLKLREERPKDAYLLKLLARTYIQLKDWFHLQLVLPQIKKNKAFNQQEFETLEKETYLHLLKDHYFSEFAEVQLLWNKLPRYLRHDPEILTAYATHLNRWNRSIEAEELIRKELKKNFSHYLMEFYVTTRSKEPAKQIALGEKYLKKNSEDPASLRAMGILCLRNRLWGQARDYLERSLRKQPTPETFSALGYVYEKLGENDKALSYYRKGLSYLTPF